MLRLCKHGKLSVSLLLKNGFHNHVHHDMPESVSPDHITQLYNRVAYNKKATMNTELLRGKFFLKMGKRLPFSSKIVALAHEPIAYYMHKKGNFIQKITDFERNALKEEEQVHENLIKRTIR